MLTPKDIEMKEFTRTKVGGYRQEEVDDFLDEILADFERLLAERESLNKRVAYLTEKLNKAREDQEKLRINAVSNQKTQDEIIAIAKKKADKLVIEAQEYSRRLIDSSKAEADRLFQIKSELVAEVGSFKSNLLNIYENHVKLISSIPNFKNNENICDAESFEILKVATADVESPAVDVQYPPKEQPKVSKEVSFEKETDFENEAANDGIEPVDDEEYSETLVIPSVRSSSAKQSVKHVRDDDDFEEDLEVDEDDDIEDVSDNDSQIKGLFSNEKKQKKPLFGSRRKKSLFSSNDDDDDDDDDEDDEDDD